MGEKVGKKRRKEGRTEEKRRKEGWKGKKRERGRECKERVSEAKGSRREAPTTAGKWR